MNFDRESMEVSLSYHEIMDKIHLCGQEILDEFVKICEQNKFKYYLYYGTLLGAIRHKGPIPWDDDVDVVMPRKDYEKFKKLMLAKSEGDMFHIHCYENDPNYLYIFSRLLKSGTVYIEENVKDVDLKYREFWIDILPLDDAPSITSFRYRILAFLVYIMKNFVWYKAKNNIGSMKFRGKLVHFFLTPFPFKLLYTCTRKLTTIMNDKGYNNYVSWGSPYKKDNMPKEWFEPATKVLYNGKHYIAPCNWHKVLKQLYGNYMLLPPKSEQMGHHLSTYIKL